MFKRFCTVLLVLALAAPAVAGNWFNHPIVPIDASGKPVTVQVVPDGASYNVIYGTNVDDWNEPALGTDTLDINIATTGYTGWILMQVPEETNLDMFWARVKYPTSGSLGTYTWSNWMPYYVGGEYRDFATSAISESLQCVFAGSAAGSVRVYIRTESMSD